VSSTNTVPPHTGVSVGVGVGVVLCCVVHVYLFRRLYKKRADTIAGTCPFLVAKCYQGV
jgi:putative Ca2+/H+ antiporter (TMEM165/GDT1 family)